MAKIVTIQNVDRPITRMAYHKFADDQLLVTSFFRTIQGEGPYAGYPAIFLRLAGCNFGAKDDHCSFCDTSFQFDQGKLLNFMELMYELTHIEGYSESDILVVTGGEPTLQRNLFPFLTCLDGLFKSIQIETNGTQVSFFKEIEDYESAITSYEEEESLRYVRPSIVVSPKASMTAGRYAEPSDYVKRYASCFKFVLTHDDSDPHHTVPEWALELARKGHRVYVSPMAVYRRPYSGEVSSAWDHDLINAHETSKNYSYACEYALKNNLLISTQQHLFLGVA